MTDYQDWVVRRRQRVTIQEIAMRPVLRRWPTVLKEDGAYEMGAGWIPLLERAAARVSTYPQEWRTQIVGCRQKFGFLLLDVDYSYSEHPTVIGSRSEIKRMREEIRLTSLWMCEICGQDGRLRQVVSAQTLCEEHAAEMGMALPDDGMIADPLDEMPKW